MPADSDGLNMQNIDRENHEFSLAMEYALQTNRSIFLSGKAGTGKTTFLKCFREITSKLIVVLAPTGIAAINANGQTIHSFFRIPPSIYLPEDKRISLKPNSKGIAPIRSYIQIPAETMQVIRNLDTIVIDEISMVRCDLLDVIDHILRSYRISSLPFGGVQLIFIGDMFQLPPVVKDDDKEILNEFYDTEFFFSSYAYKKCNPYYIELKKIYRQTEQKFINLLNNIRTNEISYVDIVLLNLRCDASLLNNTDDEYIYLTTTNARARAINNEKLGELESMAEEYSADVQGEFAEKDMPTEEILQLKVGAQVMFVRNDSSHKYVNGTIGRVVELKENEIDVEIKSVGVVSVERFQWEKIKYRWDKVKGEIKEEVIGSFKQFPLRLAWAITVHKSQGLTFDKVIADVGRSFLPGQVYVALSRCTSYDGIILLSKVCKYVISSDERVVKFSKSQKDIQELSDGFYDERNRYFRSCVDDILNGVNVDANIRALYRFVVLSEIELKDEDKEFLLSKILLLIAKIKRKRKKLKDQQKYENLMTLLIDKLFEIYKTL